MEIAIRHAEKEDISAIKKIFEQRHAIEGTLQLPFPSVDMWVARQEKWNEDFKSIVAIVEGRVVGHLGLMLISRPRRKHAASFGMAVCSTALGRGVGSALLQTAIDSCDNWLNITRIELKVFVDNEPAIALYKKFNFEIEGTHKQYGFKNGKYVDVYTMARTKTC